MPEAAQCWGSSLYTREPLSVPLPGCPFAACPALPQGNDDQSLPCVKGGGSPQGETEGLPAAGYVVMSCAVLGAAIPQPLRGSSLYTREPLSLLLPGCPFAVCPALPQGNDDQSLPCAKGGGSRKARRRDCLRQAVYAGSAQCWGGNPSAPTGQLPLHKGAFVCVAAWIGSLRQSEPAAGRATNGRPYENADFHATKRLPLEGAGIRRSRMTEGVRVRRRAPMRQSEPAAGLARRWWMRPSPPDPPHIKPSPQPLQLRGRCVLLSIRRP